MFAYRVIRKLRRYPPRFRAQAIQAYTGGMVRCGEGARVWPNVELSVIEGGRIILGRSSSVMHGTHIMGSGGTVHIGENTFIGRNGEIVANESVTIGANGLIAAGVGIYDFDHAHADISTPIRYQGRVSSPITIGDDVWLGARVVVTRGAQIGDGCIVAAGSVVRGVLPPYTIAAGTPARVVRHR